MKCLIRKCFNRPLFTLFSVITTCLLYNEVYLYSLSFRTVRCSNPDECTRILLVADPQLIGLNNERVHFITPLTIWDSDRYLANTYSLVFEHANPHIVIFLGDLFDEGSMATELEFEYYVKRFYNVFNVDIGPSSKIEYIFIPGDNDIGGEGGEIITRRKIYRFEKSFIQPDLIKARNLTFYKINRLTRSIPHITESKNFYDENIRVVVSHVPLMFTPSQFVETVLKTVQPQVLFTAHEHKSMVVSTDGFEQKDRQIIPIPQNDNKWYDFALGVDNMFEIIVPTCSYRMGTMRIGYGFAVIENGVMHYSVLWSPSRFTQLYNYLCLFILISMYLLVCVCRNRGGRTAASSSTMKNY